MIDAPKSSGHVTLGEIFRAFLLIGATSFGGGVVAYLRSSLVGKHRWADDPSFVEMLSISQSLPGLTSTNIAVLAGDRLRGTAGAIAALVGICLPGALIMFASGVAYGAHGGRPAVTAMLHGVAAAAVGLVMAVTAQIGQRAVKRLADLCFVILAVMGVHLLHLAVPYVLLGVGAVAIWWHRPRRAAEEAAGR
jgi:chromate transporter